MSKYVFVSVGDNKQFCSFDAKNTQECLAKASMIFKLDEVLTDNERTFVTLKSGRYEVVKPKTFGGGVRVSNTNRK